MAEPTFRYHPDPVATGSAVSTDAACSLCGIRRGIRYAGPVYGTQPDTLCLHCIASGEAAERLGPAGIGPAMFSDAVDVPVDVPADVVDEVTMRTPASPAGSRKSGSITALMPPRSSVLQGMPG